jgi:hypothetical protein
MAKAPPELTEALRRVEPDIQALAAAARAVVLDVIGPCYEQIVSMSRVVSVLYSTTEKRMKDNICAIVVYRHYVNLMFTRGVDLKDPSGLLEGSGKAIRHVKLRTPADVDAPAVRRLIAQARKRQGLAKPDKALRKTMTSVKTRAAEPRQPAWPRLF